MDFDSYKRQLLEEVTQIQQLGSHRDPNVPSRPNVEELLRKRTLLHGFVRVVAEDKELNREEFRDLAETVLLAFSPFAASR